MGRSSGALNSNLVNEFSGQDPTRQLSTALTKVGQARELAERISALTSDERVAKPARDVAEVLTMSMATAATLTPQTERLRVALMGRSKAGKTTLIAALSKDREATGVGVGRQRTTREARRTHLEGFDLIDLPGVGALGGEHDTALARTVAADADAVLWLYAESLQETEAAELEDLLSKGKPVVVAFNVKRKVDASDKRLVFAKTPGLAFRDLDSHRERVAQVAERARTEVPLFVAVHARAAWWGVVDGDAAVTSASRVDELLEACDAALTSRAGVLRLRARHERPRLKMVELGGAASAASSLLRPTSLGLEKRIERESVSLRRALAETRADATVHLDATHAKARNRLRRWVRKHLKDDGDTINSGWAKYVADAGFDEVAERYSRAVIQELERSRVSSAAVENIERGLTVDKQLNASKDHRLRGRLASAARIVGRGVKALVRSFGLDRGVAALVTRLGSKSNPAGWVLLATEGVAGLSEGVRCELAARRVRADQWHEDQSATCETELRAAHATVSARLDAAHDALCLQVDQQRRVTLAAIRSSRSLHKQLGHVATFVDDAVAACDLQLAQALLAHEGLSVAVRAIERIPNRQAVVWFDGNGGHTEALEALRRHLAPERVMVSAKRRGPRTMRK